VVLVGVGSEVLNCHVYLYPTPLFVSPVLQMGLSLIAL